MSSNFNNSDDDMNRIPNSLIYQACPDFDTLVDQDSIRRMWQLAFVRMGQQRLPSADDVERLIDNEEKQVIFAETREMYRKSVALHIIKKQPFFKKLIFNKPAHIDPLDEEIAAQMQAHINADIAARWAENELYNLNKNKGE